VVSKTDLTSSINPRQMPKTLADIPVGSTVKILKVNFETQYLGAMGIAQGNDLTLLRKFPWGGPYHIETCGGYFAIGSEVAKAILVN